jgi:Fe-S-cluster containining protein
MNKKITFYNNGLQFECARCSFCCRNTPGYVFISHNDLDLLVKAFKITQTEFINKYCRFIDMHEMKKLSFIEKDNFDCIFWEKSGCAIYQYRPIQCRSYPFWESNLMSHVDWAELARGCPGIGKGATHSFDSIQTWLRTIEKEDYDYSQFGHLKVED